MPQTELSGRTALVTGATAGIGRATVHALAEAGADVALAARREERLTDIANTVAETYDVETVPIPTDVREEAQVEAMVERAVERFDGLDVLVNNAGLGVDGGVEDLATEDYRLMMDVNVDGMFFATRAALPHIRESAGNLVFVASFAGQYPRPANPIYAATKWWTRGFAHSLEGIVGDSDGVAVTVVNPTEVRTEFGSEDDQPLEEEFDRGEVTEPDEIADAIVFAASQRAPTTVSEIDLYRRDKFSHF